MWVSSSPPCWPTAETAAQGFKTAEKDLAVAADGLTGRREEVKKDKGQPPGKLGNGGERSWKVWVYMTLNNPQ